MKSGRRRKLQGSVIVVVASALLVLGFQNCSSHLFGASSGASSGGSSAAVASNSDGRPFDGKPDSGDYYRLFPNEKCAGQAVIYGKVSINGQTLTAQVLNPADCSTSQQTLLPSAIEYTSENPTLLGFGDGLYVKAPAPPNPSQLSVLTEAWCRLTNPAAQDLSIVVAEDLNTHAVTAVFTTASLDSTTGLISAQPVVTQTVARNLTANALQYQGANGFALNMNLGMGPVAASSGKFAATVHAQVNGATFDQPMLCRLGANFDLQAPIKPTLALDFSNGILPANLNFARASAATYIDASGVLRTAAANQPRFNFDPASGQALGLLIEGPATNLMTYSSDLSNPVWKGQIVSPPALQGNAGPAPDGTSTATRVAGVGAINEAIIQQDAQAGANPVGGRTFSASLWIRGTVAADAAITLRLSDNSPNWTANAVYGPDLRGNYPQWTRVMLTATIGNTNPDNYIEFTLGCISGGCQANLTGSDFFIWGLQVEEGPAPTSLIMTAATSASRGSDSVTLADLSWYNPAHGAFLTIASRASFEKIPNALRPTLFSVLGATGEYSVFYDPATFFNSVMATVSWSVSGQSEPAPNSAQSLALTYQSASDQLYVNGASGSGPGPAQSGMPPTAFALGGSLDQQKWNGSISRLIYWPDVVDSQLLK